MRLSSFATPAQPLRQKLWKTHHLAIGSDALIHRSALPAETCHSLASQTHRAIGKDSQIQHSQNANAEDHTSSNRYLQRGQIDRIVRPIDRAHNAEIIIE